MQTVRGLQANFSCFSRLSRLNSPRNEIDALVLPYRVFPRNGISSTVTQVPRTQKRDGEISQELTHAFTDELAKL